MPTNISEYILNARRFRPKDSSHVLVNDIVDKLARDIALGENLKQRLHLKFLILDLYARHKESPNGWIYFSRDSNFYSLPEGYNSLGIAYRPLIAVTNRLLLYDMLEDVPGFIDEETGKSFQTRIRPTEELISYFQNIPISEIKETFVHDEAIRLRTKALKKYKNKQININKYLKYDETDYTNSIRDQTFFYNETIKHSHIDLYQINSRAFDSSKIDPTELRINLNHKSIHRVFNDDFDKGGRFYGAWWQNIPKILRNNILIDGEPTIELDFKGFHIALLYAYKGIDYFVDDSRKDPYKVDGFDRDTVKLLLQTILNSKDENEAKRGFRQARYKNYLPPMPNSDLNALIERFETMHAPIADYFYKEEGLYLQNVDARIAEHVIESCMKEGVVNLELAKKGIELRDKFIVLPIHDSFRVQAKYSDALERTMIQSLETVGRELTYLYDKNFYNYQPKFSYTELIDLNALSDDPNYQERASSFRLDGLMPELKILRKHDKDQDEDYFKLII